MYEKYYSLITTTVIAFLLLIAGIIFWHFLPQNTVQPTSILVLTPSPKISQKTTQEPDIQIWKPYNNDKYNFSLSIPADWYVQDFEKNYPNGGTLIAFSPTPLPCETCSYVHDGYFSIKIYSQKTDAQAYAVFKQGMQLIGRKKGYQPVTIDKIPGVYFENSVALENHDWVYEFSLDKDSGKAKIADAKIFQKTITSLNFTYLLFNK